MLAAQPEVLFTYPTPTGDYDKIGRPSLQDGVGRLSGRGRRMATDVLDGNWTWSSHREKRVRLLADVCAVERASRPRPQSAGATQCQHRATSCRGGA